MTQVLNHNQTQNQITNGTNYALWSQIVKMYISGKDKLGYINGDPPQPLQTNPTFKKWRTENAMVKGWLINSMDPKLVSNFIDSQRLRLFGIILLLRTLMALIHYTYMISKEEVYTFLGELDDWLDKIQANVLQIQPFPTKEQAYAQVRREDLRQSIMMMNEDTISGGAMLSRGGQKPQHQLSFQTPSNGKPNTATKPKSQGEEGGCTHCGNTKHTKETCFKLHGYPDWWHELKAKKKREASGGDNPGHAALMSVEPQLSLIPQQESSICTSEQIAQNDSGNQGYEIIGRGTKREGLYYMDDFSYGRANNMYSAGVKERQIWLWHNRLGHPSYFQEHGLHHEASCSQTPQQNNVAKYKNRHILEITQALLIATYVPKRFWPDVVMIVVYLMNRLPSRVLHYKTPLQVFAQHVTLASVIMLPPRKFGCVTYVHIHKNQRTKLDPCVVRCVFLGYAAHKKGYRCYDPTTRRLYTTMDVTFIESENFFTSQSSRSSLQGEMMSEEQNWENWPSFRNFK
ncbi:hypothetical protein AAG906_009794 [Vitis piasezkii]